MSTTTPPRFRSPRERRGATGPGALLATAVLATTLVPLLAACGSTGEETPPEPSAVSTVYVTAGTLLTDDAEVAAAEAAGYGVYESLDGSRVAVGGHDPLPQVVIDDLAAVQPNAGHSPEDLETATAEMQAGLALAQQVQATGRWPVTIVASGYYKDGRIADRFYSIGFADEALSGQIRNADGANRNVFDSPSEAQAAAQAVIDAQPDPAVFEIVDLTGS